jgi:NADPH:quinone reductase-like Zn-dependent oxidoreductase
MKAVGLTKYLPINNPESLLDLQVATPAPGERDLLVRVEAVSVNPVDTKIRAPKSEVEKEPRILGWDAAGTVEATGPAAKLFRLGDAVYGGRFHREFREYRRLLASDGGFGAASGSHLLHQSYRPAPGLDSSARQKRSFRLGIHVHSVPVPNAGYAATA